MENYDDKKITKIKKYWIWFWYNEWTRIFIVMIPSYFIFLIPLLMWLDINEKIFRLILCITYVFIFCWAILDNDFSNLRKIDMDEYRRPLKNKEKTIEEKKK